MATTGENIKALRKKLGLSQTELAERIGVRPSAVSMWEKGPEAKSGRLPEKRSLWKLAEALGVTIDEIAGDDIQAAMSSESSIFNTERDVIEYLAATFDASLKRDFAPGNSKLFFIGLLKEAKVFQNEQQKVIDILAYFRDPVNGEDYQLIMEVKKMAPAKRRQ